MKRTILTITEVDSDNSNQDLVSEFKEAVDRAFILLEGKNKLLKESRVLIFDEIKL